MPALPPAAPLIPAAPQYPAPFPAASSQAAWTRAAVPKLEEGDDVEQYLTTFERLATAYRCPPADWAIFLVPYLTGRARAAYVAKDPYDAVDYYKVKNAILAKYEISAEVYRQIFRDPHIQAGETPREFYNRLKDLYQKWMRPAEKTVEEIGETLILEQFLRSLSPDVGVWVKELTHTQDIELQSWWIPSWLPAVDPETSATRAPTDLWRRVSLWAMVVEVVLGVMSRVGVPAAEHIPHHREQPHTHPL
ncbi:hypothetical protein ACEWY4_005939 [Coilia grayii]|uniref:SCAN box domain-containing protein n=1 Tax=Coilia grayii TaxID=363190 RepID=A0ABD1KJX3_9TELE